jgi:hypothetical protein
MSLYVVALTLHVIAAVAAVGMVGAIPVVAVFARKSGSPVPAPLLATLLRITQVGLGVMLLTGVLIDVGVHGAFHAAGWFRLSGALFLFLGFSHGRLRRAARDGAPAPRIERWGWTMYATVALMAALMAWKPLS